MKLSQADLAKACGLTASYFSHIETGKVTPSLEVVEKLHKIYNVNYTFLLTGKGPMFHKDEDLESFEDLRAVIGSEQVELINEMLWSLKNIQSVRLFLLSHYAEYRGKIKGLIDEEKKNKEKASNQAL